MGGDLPLGFVAAFGFRGGVSIPRPEGKWVVWEEDRSYEWAGEGGIRSLERIRDKICAGALSTGRVLHANSIENLQWRSDQSSRLGEKHEAHLQQFFAHTDGTVGNGKTHTSIRWH